MFASHHQTTVKPTEAETRFGAKHRQQMWSEERAGDSKTRVKEQLKVRGKRWICRGKPGCVQQSSSDKQNEFPSFERMIKGGERQDPVKQKLVEFFRARERERETRAAQVDNKPNTRKLHRFCLSICQKIRAEQTITSPSSWTAGRRQTDRAEV